MSLSKAVESINSDSLKKTCKIGAILQGDQMSKEDKDYLQSVLFVPIGDPQRLPTMTLTTALNSEGYRIGISTIERHRTNTCCCFLTIGGSK